MAEGHIDSYLSVSDCVFQDRVRPITKPYMIGFKSNLAQIFTMKRQYVANKNHVARSNRPEITYCHVSFYHAVIHMLTSSLHLCVGL